MTTEPSLHAHIIGFPHYTNSKNTDDGDEEQKDEKTVARSSVYEPLYELASKYLEDGYSLLYVAESLPNGERDKAEVIENIRNANTDQAENIQNNISKGMLDVIDSDNIYKGNYNGRDIVDSLLSNISEMQRKSQEKTKGTIIFNSPDPYFSRGKYDIFRVFEREITKTLPNDASLLCWYKRKWLNKLSLAHAISLLTDHIYTIHSNWKYRKWDTNKIIDIVSKGIDNNLGEGSSILLFHTMKSAHKLDQEVLAHRPDIFEGRLKQVLGKDDANSVIDSILKEIIKEVEFSLTGNSLDNKI